MKSIIQLNDLFDWSSRFIAKLPSQDSARVITLSGDLGAGKTTLTQAVGKVLNIKETITSPTFVIQKEYDVIGHVWIKKLVHIDAYRLEQKEDLEYLGWNNLITEPGTLIIIEWPEQVPGIMFPKKHINISITINDDHSRTIEIKK